MNIIMGTMAMTMLMLNDHADKDHLNNIYSCMSNRIYMPPKVTIGNFGKPMIASKTPQDFMHLLGLKVCDITLFDNGTDELLEQGAIILPRHYHIFVGTRDGELQYKPYEYDQYRIVVTIYKDVIISIDSIG